MDTRFSAMRRVVTLIMAFASGLVILSCGKAVKNERQPQKSMNSNNDGSVISKDAGLPSFCKEVGRELFYARNPAVASSVVLPPAGGPAPDQRELCIQCQPRELVRIKCLNVKKGPLESVCHNNVREAEASGKDPVLSCESQTGNGKIVVEEFSFKPSRAERLIAALPFVSMALQLKVMPTLREGSKERFLAEKALQFATNHVKPVILGQGSDAASQFLLTTVDSFRVMNHQAALAENEKVEFRGLATGVFTGISFLVSRLDSMDQGQFRILTSTIATRFPEVAPWQFILPALFAERAENLFADGIGTSLPPELIATIVNALGQATAVRPSPAP